MQNIPLNVDKTPYEFVEALWNSFSFISSRNERHQALTNAVIAACDELERFSLYMKAVGLITYSDMLIERLNEIVLAAIDLSNDLLEENETFSDVQSNYSRN